MENIQSRNLRIYAYIPTIIHKIFETNSSFIAK